MPIISTFFGIYIRMFWDDHAPPHFHAKYGEYDVLIDIQTLKTIRGSMSPKALSIILEWAGLHQEELMEDWKLCEMKQKPIPIEPLQ